MSAVCKLAVVKFSIHIKIDHSVNKVGNGKKSLVSYCNTLAYREGKKKQEYHQKIAKIR